MEKTTGPEGERDICNKVACPNCGKQLMCLPEGYPLYDIQCTACLFRAQVKTNNCRPKNEILGAGWDIMDKVTKSGYVIPPLITNFVWEDKTGVHQEISFYPFVPKANLKKYTLSEAAQRANYRMFRYAGLDNLPRFVLYTS